MSRLSRQWAFAVESSTGANEIIDAPVAEFNIEVNPDVDEDGAPLEAVDANGEPTFEVVQNEINEGEEEIQDAEETVEKLEDTSEVLEQYALILDSRISQGVGITTGEYQMLMVGVESRVANARTFMPSIESARYNRLNAAVEVLENIKEGIRRVWEAIKNTIKSLIRKVKGWWIKTFDGAKKLQKRAEGIRTKNSSLNGGISDSDDLDLGSSMATKLSDKEGKPVNKQDAFVKGVKQLEMVTEIFAKYLPEDYDSSLDNLEGSITKVVDEISKNQSAREPELKSLAEHLKSGTRTKVTSKMSMKPVNNKDSSAPSMDYLRGEHDLFGGKCVYHYDGSKSWSKVFEAPTYTSEAKTNEDGSITAGSEGTWKVTATVVRNYATEISKHRVYIGNYYLKPKEVRDSKFPILTLRDIDDCCETVAHICNMISQYKQQWERRERQISDVERTIDSSVKEFDSNTDVKDMSSRSAVNALLRAYSTQVRTQMSDTSAAMRYLLTTSDAVLTYCTRSQSRYKKG